MELFLEFKVKIEVLNASEALEVAEALKDYLYDADNTRVYNTDPKVVDVNYKVHNSEGLTVLSTHTLTQDQRAADEGSDGTFHRDDKVNSNRT